MNKQTTKIFNNFNKLKVLIIGDVMVDSYIWGKVERISPEAPIPIVTIHKREDKLGGAGNVALNVIALGAKPIIATVIGDDLKSRVFLQLLKKHNITDKGIILSKNRITTTKFRIIGNNVQMLRVDEEIDIPVSRQETNRLLSFIKKTINSEHIDVIIFQDYDKGVITETLIKNVIEISHKKKIPVAVDPKNRNFLLYKNVDLFKPNLKELKEGLKIDTLQANFKELNVAVNKLSEILRPKIIIVTLSETGVFVKTDKICKIIPVKVRKVADVSGAGDTVISVSALCLALGLNPVSIGTFANLAGGLVCEKPGIVPVDKKELLKEILARKI